MSSASTESLQLKSIPTNASLKVQKRRSSCWAGPWHMPCQLLTRTGIPSGAYLHLCNSTTGSSPSMLSPVRPGVFSTGVCMAQHAIAQATLRSIRIQIAALHWQLAASNHQMTRKEVPQLKQRISMLSCHQCCIHTLLLFSAYTNTACLQAKFCHNKQLTLAGAKLQRNQMQRQGLQRPGGKNGRRSSLPHASDVTPPASPQLKMSNKTEALQT